MRLPRTRHLALSLTVAGLLLAAACGPKAVDPEDAAAPDGAIELVAAAGERTCAVDTGRYVMTATRSAADGGQDLANVIVTFDRPAGLTATTLTTSGASAVALDMVTQGDVAYVKVPLLGTFFGADKPWVKIGEPGQTAMVDRLWQGSLGTADSCDVLGLLRSVAGTVTEVGTETIDGVETTHYTAVVDPHRAVESAPAEQRDQLSSALDRYAADATVPVEVWIDANGVVRRQTATLDATTLSGRVRGTGTMTLTVDLTDLGQPVEITVPPADQVSDFDPMSALGTMLDGLGTTPGGS